MVEVSCCLSLPRLDRTVAGMSGRLSRIPGAGSLAMPVSIPSGV